MKVSRAFDSIDVVTSAYADVPTRLLLFQEPLQDHVDFLFAVSNLTVTKQALNVTYDLKLQTHIESGYRFRTTAKLSAFSTMLVMVRNALSNPYEIKNTVVVALTSPCAVLVKSSVGAPVTYLERRRFSISNLYDISNKVYQLITSLTPLQIARPFEIKSAIAVRGVYSITNFYDISNKVYQLITSLIPLRMARSFEIKSSIAVRGVYSITNFYDLEKRLTMALAGVYGGAVSMGCVGSSQFAVRLCGALSGVYGISKHVQLPMTGIFKTKVEKSGDFPSKFLVKQQYPLTVPNRYVYHSKSFITGKADVLSYTLIRKQMRSVYNISVIKTRGLTMIQLVKF